MFTHMWQLDRIRHTISKVGYFNATSTSISVENLNALDCLRHQFWQKIVSLKEESFEHPRWRNSSWDLFLKAHDTHVVNTIENNCDNELALLEKKNDFDRVFVNGEQLKGINRPWKH